ncbi:MAG: PKD domain-containing protein [Chitinophagaceae bacterium]|nr:PKD domain-containing protein [Chitinophagaceae bacterium]
MKKVLLLLLLSSNAAIAQVNLNQGLMAHYPFNGNANDVSGNNNNPVFNSATLTTDRFGNPNSAYLFNGIDNYMRIPNSPTLNTANTISVCAWVKVSGFYNGTCHGNSIVMRGDQDYLPGNYGLRFDDNPYTNMQNCVIPSPDQIHQNFYGVDIMAPAPGYSPNIQIGTWYSVVYTNDGTTAKLYVNCQLKVSAPSGGLTFNGTHDLFLGRMNNSSYPYWLNGVMDEVRIYDRALNASEVSAYGDCLSLTGTNISNIINTYTPVIALSNDPCTNTRITVEDASTFNTGDTVMIIQMKGAVIDSTNTAAFGTITDYKNAGNYEINYVKSKTGNIIELKNVMTRQYDIPAGKVQLIRVPYYPNANITSTLTCLPWDGNKGGVLVLNVQDTIQLAANIDVSGKGFRGGVDPFTNPPAFYCYENNFYYPVNPDLASGKGEGIAEVSAAKSFGKGALANGGGGGNSHNSGGGGGSNSALGGFGGYNFEGSPCNTTVPFDNRGIGGKALTYSNAVNKIFMGGGGGGGHTNNPEAFIATGGNGAGIAIIMADKFKPNGFQVLANGNAAAACGATTSGCHDGMGGGGAGGTVLSKVNNYIGVSLYQIQGGQGGNMTASGFLKVGPGGGGGGGKVWFSSPSQPVGSSVTVSGGQNGVCTAYSNDPWGATPGQLGSTSFDLSIPIDNVPFKPNIDSVRIKDSITSCNSFDFKGFGYTNTNPIASWQWYFGDGGTANTQNTSHTYASGGTYTVKLVVTDINGCKDSLSINVTPNCLVPISNIINNYTPVLAFDICKNLLTVEDASAFNAGDTVLMIQMKGAVIDSTNTAAFGTITDYKNAGNYEFNYVKSKAGNVVELMNTIIRQYDVPVGKVQLIRVPYYQSALVNSTLTCLPWDGSKGGVLVVNVRDTLELNADINTSGKGFLKGIMPNSNSNTFTCSVTNFYAPNNTLDAAGKGEGITFLSANRNSGKGPAANGGGGGMNANSGGAGGSNGNKGGRGGNEWNNGCPNYLTSQNWGWPGNSLTYNTTNNKIFMGGGGGAGHCNNQFDDPTFNADYNGGNGGGLVIINADYIKNNSRKIISKGDSAYQPVFSPTYVTHDGMGGGGAGGTVLLNTNNYINNLQVDVSGGKGANMMGNTVAPGFVGPGGGGGGGVLWVKQNSLPANVIATNAGGLNGVIVQGGNTAYGAAPGLPGINVFSLSVPVALVPFKPNIDSVRIKDSATACKTFDFKGFGYTNTNPMASWQWYFGDGGTANTQNTSHTYSTLGTFTVKLVVFDINGCTDSITKNVIVDSASVVTNADTPICEGTSIQLNATGTSTYSWAPATGLNNANIPNPIATPLTTTQYIVTGTNANGCSAKDSVWINVNPAPAVTTSNDTTICTAGSAQLFASGGGTYSWSPAATLNNASAPNPVATPAASTLYYVTVTGANSCTKRDSVQVNVRTAATFSISPPDDVCRNGNIQLLASGGDLYSWTPAASLNNATIANPVATPTTTTIYSVQISDTLCNNTGNLSTTITVLQLPVVTASRSNDIDCSISQSQLSANGASTYAWSPGATLNNPNLQNPVATPLTTTTYIVTGTDASGCSNSANVIVKVSPNANGGYLMPTAFTPNGDGLNDCYGIKQWGTITELEFSIYNRWGERVFFTTDPNKCWDGTYKGIPQDSYVFVYMVKAKTTCQPEVFRKGTFALIR